MSTQYHNADTDQWACVFYAGGREAGPSVDFGTVEHRQAVEFAAASGARFKDESGYVYEGTAFLVKLLGRQTSTYGQFGGTMEVGSGDIATFTGLDEYGF